jgi:hypothetical protein
MTPLTKLETPQSEKRRFWREPRFWLGLASSLIFLWLVLRRVSWPEVLAALRTARWELIPLGLLLMTTTWALFAIRWQELLRPAASVSWADTFAYIMIGYLGNAILPLRLGDLGRMMLLSQKHKLNVGFASATLVMERLLDVLTVVVMAGLLMLVVPVPVPIRHGVQAVAVMTVVAFLVLALLSRSGRAVARLESLLARFLPQRILEPTFGILYRFAQGLQVTRSVKQMLNVGGLSLLSWVVAGVSMWCFLRAFQLDVSWEAAVLVLVVTNLGGAIPSSPGSIGVYEFLTLLALSVWISDEGAMLGFATVTHVATLGWSVVLGLMATWQEGVRLSTIVSERQGWTDSYPASVEVTQAGPVEVQLEKRSQ